MSIILLLQCFIVFRGSYVSQLSVLCFRDRTREGQRDVGHSLYYEKVELPIFEVAEDCK